MNLTAITTIAGLEVRQRIRSTRWKWTLGVLFVLVSLLIFGSLWITVGFAGATYAQWATFLFDIALTIVLFLGLAAAPTMSATSINGDRRDATLALVQATPITAAELTLGKLIGSWMAALSLIGVVLPYLIWGLFTGAMSIVSGLLGIVVTALLLGCYCALGLAFSSLTVRPAASAMLTQATVLMLLIGLPIAFGMTMPLVSQQHQVLKAKYDYYDDGSTCVDELQRESFLHTERTWWLMLPNPVLVVTDAVAGGVGIDDDGEPWLSGTILPASGQSMARSGPRIEGVTCAQRANSEWFTENRKADNRHELRYVGHSWYLGLLVNIAIGAFSVWIAIRRLRVPARRLPKGVRVA